MTPNELVCQLENATSELLAAAGVDLDRVQKLLECRAAVLARIDACSPASFTQKELSNLRAAVRNGEAALEKLTLLRRRTSSDLHRLNHLPAPVHESTKPTFSISG